MKQTFNSILEFGRNPALSFVNHFIVVMKMFPRSTDRGPECCLNILHILWEDVINLETTLHPICWHESCYTILVIDWPLARKLSSTCLQLLVRNSPLPPTLAAGEWPSLDSEIIFKFALPFLTVSNEGLSLHIQLISPNRSFLEIFLKI